MSAHRKKTISVFWVQDEINRMLSLDTLDQKQKIILCTLLERVLMDTKNYAGFGYNTWLNGGFDHWKKDGEPDFQEKDKYLMPEYDRTYYKK